jgi:hypothetical protein
MAKNNKLSTRYRLLPYLIMARRWMLPAILMIPAGYGLTLVIPYVSELNTAYAGLGWLISIVGALLTVYTLMARLSHVRLYQDHLALRLPIYPIAISYKRIRLIYPIELNLLFPPRDISRAHQRMYHKLWGKTVPVLILDGLPLPRWWLKLWLHQLLLHPDEDGIILVVEDWMGISRALDTLRTDTSKTPWQYRR